MRTRANAIRTAVVLATLQLLTSQHALADAPSVAPAFSTSGLSSLKWRDTEFLVDGGVQLADLKVGGDSLKGSFDRTGGTFDATKNTIEVAYNWGKIRVAYRPAADRLAMDVEIVNTAARPLTRMAFTLLKLQFPATPDGEAWAKRYLVESKSADEIPVVLADWKTGKCAVCRDDNGPGAATIAFQPVGDKPYQLNVGIGGDAVPAHATRRMTISVRLGDPATTIAQLTGDVSRTFAAKHPATLDWPDRRPIGSAFLSTSVAGYKKNPRGWLLDPEMDVNTAAGRLVFKQKIMAYGDSVVAHCKTMNAQGVIVWDLEGQEMPHATSYIADPRVLKQVAPEMDAIADEFIKKFKDAGLRVGLTIRPTRVTRADKGRPGWMQADVKDQVAEIDAKLTYAEKRWGCTLFYVDSNVDFVKDPNDGHVLNDPPMAAAGFKTLAEHHPKCLLMPEHKSALYWAYTAPYSEYRLGFTGTPPVVRDAYPKAFSVMQVVDGLDLKSPESIATLTAAIKAGDILLFRPWWDDPQSADILNLYKFAASGGGAE